MIIINANAFLDAMEFRMSDLIIENGKIIRILPAGSADPFEPEVINLQGAKLYPGFIDLQINGCGGIIYNDAPTAEKISYMQEINSRSGTTTFLPTLVTTTAENIDFAIDEMRKFQDLHGRLSVPGIHIEGPFISPAKSGIHNKANIRRFTDEKLANSSPLSSLKVLPPAALPSPWVIQHAAMNSAYRLQICAMCTLP